ncbi:MAG: helix-turn-helix domain-containing protein [Phycisphaerales bacterium]
MTKRTIYSREYELLLEMLREVRQRRGFTQEEMAKRLSTTQSAFSKSERGEVRLDMVQVRDRCHAMGVSFARFAADFDRRAGVPSGIK